MKISYSDWKDSDLWEVIKQENNELAFAELHYRFSHDLYKVAFRKIGDRTIAEDILQDLFINIWLKRHQIEIKKGIHLYLFTTLKNMIINHFRLKYERLNSSLDLHDQQQLAHHASNTTEEFIFLADLQQQYDLYLSELPEKSRIVFELSRSGLTNREISDSLGIVEKTVEFHISKCIRILKHKLEFSVILLHILHL